ncbi:MAG: nucleoside hydrolase, partial [Synechococcaceae cyanobacterium ELA263]
MDWILDTDMGLDDQISLLYLAKNSQIAGSDFNLQAVLTQGTGLAHAQAAKANAVRLLRFAGISSETLPPVGLGSQDTLEGFHQYPPAWRYQEDNLRGAVIPDFSQDVELQNSSSSKLLETILANSSQKVSILEIGTYTTLAQVLLARPELAKKIDRIVSMVGAVDVPGNIHGTSNQTAEFNAWIDPVAAKVVFDSGITIEIIPLDATDKAPLTQDFLNRFRSGTSGPEADLLEYWWESVLSNPVGEYYHWDPLATVIATSPEVAAHTEAVKLSVNADLVGPGQSESVPFGKIDDFSLLNWQGQKRSSLAPLTSGWTKRDDTGRPIDVVFDANVPLFEEKLISAFAKTSDVSPSIRVAVFGDAGNSYTNGTNFYYSPGGYRRLDLGSTGPQQQAVAAMMRSWNPSDLIQLGDESYNVNSSSLLDYNIGQYYNDFIYPYAPPAFTQPGSIYTDGELGGIPASVGQTQWPYNLYNFPYGFPNPSDPSKPGGSSDGVNHYFAVPGNQYPFRGRESPPRTSSLLNP